MSAQERILLRSMTREDTALIVRWRNNPRVRRNFVYRETFTPAIHERWIAERIEGARDVVQWIVCVRDPESGAVGRPIGSVYFRDIDWDTGEAEYGVLIGEDDAIGDGHGNEIALLACARAKELGLQRVILRVFCDNTPAIRSYEYAGFAVTEKLPAVRCSDGEEKDMLLMERML